MAMHKSLFDLSIEETTSTEMPHTVKFSNETGTGSMIICPLFLGAELYYNDMHLAFFEEATAPMRNVIEINHCRVGRYECSFGANSCCYLAAGDFAVCAAARKKLSCFSTPVCGPNFSPLGLDKNVFIIYIRFRLNNFMSNL